jgi:hypothetical protein
MPERRFSMITVKVRTLRIPVLLLVLSLSGCSAINVAIDGVSGGIERGTENALLAATGLADMQDSVFAMVMYTNAFFAGGFMYGYENFTEGEGVSWRVISENDGDQQVISVERALLKRMGDSSSWWQLFWSDGEEEYLSEALIDRNYELLKFRYIDPETGDIREWIPEQTEEEVEEADAEEAELPDYYEGSWQDNVVDTSSVTVPAGTFSARRVLIEERDVEEEGSPVFRYEWWISESVPGNLVKYRWEDLSDGSSLTGELVSHRKGYKSRLDSY